MGTRGRRIERVTWVLFSLCPVFYSVTSIRAGDWLSLAGSILFFLVCIVFVPVPMWDRDTDGSGADGD